MSNILNKKVRTKKVVRPDDWVHFPWAFLDVAEFSCDFWLDAFKANKFKGKMSVRSYIAIVFNIKHSLELFLKRCIIHYFGVLESKERNHDLKKLFAKFNQIDFSAIKNIISQIPEATDEGSNEYVAKVIITGKKSFPNKLKKLGGLVDRYYHLKFTRNFVAASIAISDTDNDIFRYPENKLDVSINYETLLDKISINDFKELKEDILLLTWVYSNIGFVLRVAQGRFPTLAPPSW